MVQRFPKRTLFLSVVLATILHAGFLLVPLLPSIPTSRIARDPIQVTLVSRTVAPAVDVDATTATAVPDSAGVKPTVDRETDQNAHLRPATPSPEEKEHVSAPNESARDANRDNTVKVVRPPPSSVRAMARTYLAQKTTESEQSPSQTCDLAQRASKFRHCDEGDEDVWRDISNQPYEETFDVAFAPQTYADYFRSQKVRVDRLVKQQELLDEIVKLEGFEPDDIAQLQNEIREEIDRINSTWAPYQAPPIRPNLVMSPEVNLLSIIALSVNVTVDLWNARKQGMDRASEKESPTDSQ